MAFFCPDAELSMYSKFSDIIKTVPRTCKLDCWLQVCLYYRPFHYHIFCPDAELTECVLDSFIVGFNLEDAAVDLQVML